MNLDLELGTFHFNDRSMWADPGPIEPGTLPMADREDPPPASPEPLPAPPASPAASAGG
jgi:hypothetical protein